MSEKLEKAGTVDFKKHPARKVGARSRQCGPKVPGRFALPGARNPRICSISRCGNSRSVLKPDAAIASEVSILSKNSLAITSFPREPQEQPQPSPSLLILSVLCKKHVSAS